MPLGELAIIERFFAHLGAERPDVLLGPGDDAALLRVAGPTLVVTHSYLLGRDYSAGEHPRELGARTLSAPLEALRAAGGEPAWLTLTLSLPEADEAWLRGYSEGLAALATEQGVALVGGDVTRGPGVLTLHLMGPSQHGPAGSARTAAEVAR